MSTGHLKHDVKSDADMYRLLGEGDTPDLYTRSFAVDTSHTIPYAGGTSVDGKTVYIDKGLYREIMSGRCAVKGMSPRQIIQAIIEHEHTEFAIDAGDNDVDVYEPAHEVATAKEHKFVKQLRIDPDRYEESIRPALQRVLKRPPTNPPRDLWCGPYLDHADKADKEVLRQLKAKNVEDAFKLSKFDVHYSIGPNECRSCVMFNDGTGPLRKCDLVSGLVRDKRWCDRWKAKAERK